MCFITLGPEPREVFAADLCDRIVHHLLIDHQERMFEPIFVHELHAYRQDKGTLAASDRLSMIRSQTTRNGKRPAWCLNLDVASFFPSNYKATQYQIIARDIADPLGDIRRLGALADEDLFTGERLHGSWALARQRLPLNTQDGRLLTQH